MNFISEIIAAMAESLRQKMTDTDRAVRDNGARDNEMAAGSKNVKLLLAGLVVMVSGYILMSGGGSDDPQVFNYAMFDFRRLVAAPVVIICGIVVEIVAIMKVFKN